MSWRSENIVLQLFVCVSVSWLYASLVQISLLCMTWVLLFLQYSKADASSHVSVIVWSCITSSWSVSIRLNIISMCSSMSVCVTQNKSYPSQFSVFVGNSSFNLIMSWYIMIEFKWMLSFKTSFVRIFLLPVKQSLKEETNSSSLNKLFDYLQINPNVVNKAED